MSRFSKKAGLRSGVAGAGLKMERTIKNTCRVILFGDVFVLIIWSNRAVTKVNHSYCQSSLKREASKFSKVRSALRQRGFFGNQDGHKF